MQKADVLKLLSGEGGNCGSMVIVLDRVNWYDELSELPPVIFCEWKDEENHRFHVFPLSAENAKAMAQAAESWIESN